MFPRLRNMQPSHYTVRAIGAHNTQHTPRSQCAEKSDGSLIALKADLIRLLYILVLQLSEMMQNQKKSFLQPFCLRIQKRFYFVQP